MLTEEQKSRAVEVMREYLIAPSTADSKTPLAADVELDVSRAEVIEQQLKPLLASYLSGKVALAEFKSKVDSINKRHVHWGFKGIKGQMFFNLLANVARDVPQFEAELKSALRVPSGEDVARSQISTFTNFVRRVGETYVEAGGSKHSRPNPSSVPFFVTYFWQVQDRNKWPVYYTNSVNVMTDLDLWEPSEDEAENYITFKRVQEELAVVFTQASRKTFGFYGVEHVFWFKSGRPYGEPNADSEAMPGPEAVPLRDEEALSRLPESFVPPVVAILPRMARNESVLAQVAKASGTSLERLFEKNINAAFTILGYETKLMGHGQGRVPDGLAVDRDSSYAIIWDAKVRGDGYSIGTDDRTIREYVTTQSRELKRRRSVRNIYYVIVSSSFADDYDDVVRAMKMETDVNEVCFVKADALVAMVDAKLRDPLQVTLGPDGLQRLFSSSGVISSETVREIFV